MEQDSGQSEAATGPRPEYAFLNHSTDTLENSLPPDVDNKPLARQKRKRTSPEDQAVLEAAYINDPKPDKEARLQIVNRIALGEKEVQIWFQNRRQTSRRKSRPLLPHEIAQFQMSRYGSSSLVGLSSDEAHAAEEESRIEVSQTSPSASPSSNDESIKEPSLQIDIRTEQEETQQSSLPPLNGLPAASSYLANRRSLPSLSQVLHELGSTIMPAASTNSLRKSASFVRLSMTSGGNAKVITKESLSPSPPRPDPALKRTRDVSPSPRQFKRSISGRSRDSRAWEFWCDKDCRSELEEKAQKDGKGSAADAIGMLRAVNTRKALQPVPLRHNAVTSKHQPWSKHSRPDARRPGLQRAYTSEGRLQHAAVPAMTTKRKKLDKQASLNVHIPGNESDKENWSPGGESTMNQQSKDKNAAILKDKRKVVRDKENANPEDDAEVAAFMKQGRAAQRQPGDEELDCVQGLLSLSQGNWAT